MFHQRNNKGVWFTVQYSLQLIQLESHLSLVLVIVPIL